MKSVRMTTSKPLRHQEEEKKKKKEKDEIERHLTTDFWSSRDEILSAKNTLVEEEMNMKEMRRDKAKYTHAY